MAAEQRGFPSGRFPQQVRDIRRQDGLIDDAVVEAMRLGLAWAWDQAWATLAMPLGAFVRSMGATSPEAEDLVAETFARMIAHRERLPVEPAAVRAWAFKVARNLLIDDRRSARHRSTTAVDPADATSWNRADLDEVGDPSTAWVVDTLGTLPLRQREVILLHVYGDLSLRDVAYVLGMTHAATRKAFSRAAERLRAAVTGGQ